MKHYYKDNKDAIIIRENRRGLNLELYVKEVRMAAYGYNLLGYGGELIGSIRTADDRDGIRLSLPTQTAEEEVSLKLKGDDVLNFIIEARRKGMFVEDK